MKLNEGWITWGGGECPVDADALVDVKYRSGGRSTATLKASEYRWNDKDIFSDIIAYRLHNPEVKVVEWNGEGLPPVGVECVVTPHNTSWGFSVVDEYKGKVLAYDGEDFWFSMLGGVKVASRTDKVDFRPLRTEAERKRELAVNDIAELCRSAASNGHAAELVYDAIASGKIPGVKLED